MIYSKCYKKFPTDEIRFKLKIPLTTWLKIYQPHCLSWVSMEEWDNRLSLIIDHTWEEKSAEIMGGARQPKSEYSIMCSICSLYGSQSFGRKIGEFKQCLSTSLITPCLIPWFTGSIWGSKSCSVSFSSNNLSRVFPKTSATRMSCTHVSSLDDACDCASHVTENSFTYRNLNKDLN